MSASATPTPTHAHTLHDLVMKPMFPTLHPKLSFKTSTFKAKQRSNKRRRRRSMISTNSSNFSSKIQMSYLQPQSSIFLFFFFLLLFLLSNLTDPINGFGSMGPISAAFGDNGFFCAIDASGKQEIFCWEKNNSSSSASAYFSTLPPMAALTGGEGFMCGLIANTSQPYCWNSLNSGITNLVPSNFRPISYSHISAGKTHVCAIRGSYYTSLDSNVGVDCWNFSRSSKNMWSFLNANVSTYVLGKTVSGEGFSCSDVRDGGIVCWGPNSSSLGMSPISQKSDSFVTLASSRSSVCGISEGSGEVRCWGDPDSFREPPVGIPFVELTAGARHFCGIREDNHGVMCWGDHDPSLISKASGFLAIASSDYVVCGVREDDLILDCWGAKGKSPSDYSPPLQLSSPGLCMAGSCGDDKFAFNASILGVPGLISLCVRTDLKICSPCGSNCSEGFFPSSVCSDNADRVCTSCSLCQNSSCWDICGHPTSDMQKEQREQIKRLAVIIGSSISGFTLLLIGWCFFPRVIATRKEDQRKAQCCMSKPAVEADVNAELELPLTASTCVGAAQVFRLSELKDATNGFKEFNELGRGSYGFVYKAVLSDGRQVAVKRANAATIIHTNSREFESELEILCSIRHGNIVNLLGYCAEMGERLLVYEFMPHGTLHNHLHSGLSPINWSLRLKIALQAAWGLEYLHKDATPPIVHRNINTSNILLDSEWVARIADFRLLSTGNRDQSGDSKGDVFSFGVVLLEILSGRKDYDNDYTPSNIVEWAMPLIQQGKSAAIIDHNIALPRNVEPLLKLSEVAGLALKEDPSERPSMSNVALWLEQILKMGLTV